MALVPAPTAPARKGVKHRHLLLLRPPGPRRNGPRAQAGGNPRRSLDRAPAKATPAAARHHHDMPYQRPEGDRDWGLLRRFGVEFRRCRVYAGLSQVELARRSGVSQSTISRIERGKAPSASLIKLVRISHAMGAGFPFAYCPHPHFCPWNRLDEDGRASLDPRRPIAAEEFLADIYADGRD